jgi:hypothetical protein
MCACVVMVLGTGCDNGVGGEGGGRLNEALSFAPSSYESFGFTDWEAMREYGDLDETEAADADPESLVVFNEPNSPLGFSYNALQYPDHRSNWGWNELDLDWEAEVVPTEGPPYNVLGFNDDFDLADLTSKLAEQGFESSEIEGGELYQVDDPLSLFGSVPTTDISIGTVAVIDEENVAIVGGTEDSAEIHADEAASLAGSESIASITERFGDFASVALVPGETCADPALGGRTTPQIEELFEDLRGAPYETLAMGYRVEGEGETMGAIVMHYGDSSAAEDDLELRTGVLEEENSIATRQPYSELLEVTDSEVDDSDLVIEVGPADGSLQLFDLLLQRDLAFALC